MNRPLIPQISLASLGIALGAGLTTIGGVAYGTGNATLNLIGFFYGVPLLLGGLAFKAAELKPVPARLASPEVQALRQSQATPTQNQIRRDVTRYRYGEAAHLDAALTHLGLKPTDQERPVIIGLQEQDFQGAYGLVLQFESPHIPFSTWQDKQARMEKFFGPGVKVILEQPKPDRVDLALVALDQPGDSQAAVIE